MPSVGLGVNLGTFPGSKVVNVFALSKPRDPLAPPTPGVLPAALVRALVKVRDAQEALDAAKLDMLDAVVSSFTHL